MSSTRLPNRSSITRSLLAVVLSAAPCVVFAACGDDDKPAALGSGGTGGRGGTGGTLGGADGSDGNVAGKGGTGGKGGSGARDGGDSGDAGGTGGTGGVQNVRAPVVAVTKPAALSDPSATGVLIGDVVDVTCTVSQSTATGSKPVNETSVRLELLDAEGESVESAPGSASTTPHEFSARFSLIGRESGRISFRCTAEDQSDPPLKGSNTIQTLVDRGPLLTIASPLENSPWALKQPMSVDFTVDPVPLATVDAKAAVTEVKFSANGVNIPLPTPLPATPNRYIRNVLFSDKTLFPGTLPRTIPIVITAKNGRGAVANRTYTIDLDGEGPVIAVQAPPEDAIVAGEFVLKFTVSDSPAGVDKATVVVTIEGTKHPFKPQDPLWTEKDGAYEFHFDSNLLEATIAQITVNIEASDVRGNVSPGASRTLYIDNLPPIVDLDPRPIRERTRSGTTLTCTNAFDPLGDLAANDLGSVKPSHHFRVLAWDQTNRASDQDVLHPASVDDTSVYLYLQPNTNLPLLVDSNDEDKICDAIKTDVDPKLPFLVLKAVPPTGTAASFNPEPTILNAPPLPAGCALRGDVSPPGKLCQAVSDMTRVVTFATLGTYPAVFAGGSLTGFECTGNEWEIGSKLPAEGWACLAARARDKLGNTGVSAPLRVCVHDGVGPEPACATSSVTPPSCTDGCTPPPHFPYAVIGDL